MAKEPKAETRKTHNLDDEQLQALATQHKEKYISLLAKKKEADAAVRNLGKIIKADLGDVGMDMIKLWIKLDAGETDVENAEKEKVNQTLRVMRWAGIPLGTQGNLFTAFDERPLEERAFEAGRAAGMKGDAMKPTLELVGTQGPAFEEWCRGWHLGQDKVFDIRKPKGKEGDGTTVN